MIDLDFDPSLESLVKQLDKYGDELREKRLRSALVSGARPLKKEMKALAPKDKGDLEKSIGHRKISEKEASALGLAKNVVAVFVGPRKGFQGFIGRLQEEGTKNMKPNQFVEPALERTQAEIQQRFYKSLSNWLNKQQS